MYAVVHDARQGSWRKHGETIVAAARHKLTSEGSSEVLTVAKRLIDHLRKVCNDNAMEKRDKYIRMSARWSTGSPLACSGDM